MKSGKRKRDDENDADDSSSSEEERVEVKKRKFAHWTKKQEMMLKSLKGKGYNWAKIAESFPGRTLQSCQQRYSSYVNVGENRVQVSWPKEHDLLLKKLKEKGLKWPKIAKSFPG
jgi:hypothetical protein